jgi:hypothetical protein
VPYQKLERLRIRIEAELEERREAGERSHESAVEVLSAFKAASSPAMPVRSRDVSLVTSFGSCGPIYGSLIPCPKAVE